MGKVCDGYSDDGESRPAARRSRLLSPQPPSIARCNTHAGLAGLSYSDKRHFEWFVRETSGKLPGVFSSPFWTKLVLQASSAEPSILYAVLALGAVHKNETKPIDESCDVKDEESWEPQSSDITERLSLQYYNKSISLLQSHLLMPGTESTRVVLIVCTIFVCLEFMQKRYKTGFLHFGHSLRLLDSLLRSTVSALPVNPTDEWFAEEIPRLDIQAALLTNEFYLGGGSQTPLIWISIPRPFQTTRDASNSLDGLLFRAHQLQKNGSEKSLAEEAADIFELLATQQTLRNNLEVWLQCFDVFKAKTWDQLSDGDRLVCRRLPIYHTMAYIITNTALNPGNELIFDLYTRHFVSVVSLSREILDTVQPSALPTPAAETPGSHASQADYTADSGLVPPLFYTAIKCRVPRIRRQAVELILLGQRHEGIWDAVLSARVAREVMTLEERGVQDGLKGDQRASPDTVVPIFPSPPRVHKLWIEAPGEPKGDIRLSVQRIHADGELETLARRYDMINGFWTSIPITPRVAEATEHQRRGSGHAGSDA
ncbi:C6 zinc finger domain-containing protein [Colletotrichum tofieldiae]|uniref:C6 zinc finger domain-containing protein n=1 Tax=Colletotrichum tofieldiae TaxID=708197 RepID=A0A161VQ50_9PEZI|nr:C6 zinc finger domain-containing protein [Colletotrichum tofieldiae]